MRYLRENVKSGAATMKRWILWTVARSLLFILLGITVATLVVTGRFWWQQEVHRAPTGASTADAVKEKLDAYSERADELEKLLSLLLGVSTIYAIALGLSAYQQLKDSTDKLEALSSKAEDEIRQLPGKLEGLRKDAQTEIQKQIADAAKELANLKQEAENRIRLLREDAQKEIDEFVVKVETKFPLFADMDISILAIVDQLIRLLPVMDSSEWNHQEYQTLIRERGQEIAFYEKTVAALIYFDLQRASPIRRTVSEIYHGLGNFYGLKYYWEGKQVNDKERARFYLERAIQHDAANSGALNDRGYLATYLDEPPDRTKAKALFSKSLEVDPEQQRARYNLAFLEHDEGNYRRSVELLGEALEMKRWQARTPARNRNSILYNQACAYARLNELPQAMANVEVVFPAGPDYTADEWKELVTQFKNDIKPNEDLYPLAATEPFASKIKALAARLP
jgi:hypothetical protein